MILPKASDALHKAVMYRLLMHILDTPKLAQTLFFKGGTCAAMLGWLDRYSIDLDFDLKGNSNVKAVRKLLLVIFRKLDLKIKEQSATELFFVLKYEAFQKARNTLKLSLISEVVKSNQYQSYLLPEINRYCLCQTKETMFTNKLVALTDRYKKHKVIAGRDLYDIHFFLVQGVKPNLAVIEERTKQKASQYLAFLIEFIDKNITQRLIDEDINILLPKERFKAIRQTLKTETLVLLKQLKVIG